MIGLSPGSLGLTNKISKLLYKEHQNDTQTISQGKPD